MKTKEYVVAVICNTVEDFQVWSLLNKHKPTTRRSTKDYTYKNKRYICIVSVENTRGYTFNEIYATESAMFNKKYSAIVEAVNFNLVTDGINNLK